MSGLADDIFKAIVGFIVIAAIGLVVVAGGGAVGAYLLAGALGAGKGLAIAAGVVGALAVPAATAGGYTKIKNWNRERERKKREKEAAAYRASHPIPQTQPAAQAAPTVQPSAKPSNDDTPPVFVDALERMKELSPDDRKKYLDRLRDAFPNEVETLHQYNDGMALAHETPAMKKITLKKSGGPA